MIKKLIYLSLIPFVFFISCLGFSLENYPVLSSIVTDQAEIFTLEQKQDLGKKLKSLEEKTTVQLVVVTIKSLKGESIETYALETFNRNKLGQKDVDNGVLILFSEQDRKVRIEVGYGLEHILTDVISSRIIYDVMIPEFKNQRYFEGIDQAIDKIIELINDPSLVGQYKDKLATAETTKTENSLATKIFMAVFSLLGGGMLLVFLGLGFRFFFTNYKKIIEAFFGLFTGKISLLIFPLLLFSLAISSVFSIIMLVMPIGFASFFASAIFDFEYWPFEDVLGGKGAINETLLISTILLFYIGAPILIALFKVLTGHKSSFGFSLSKSNKSYMKKNFPSGSGGSSSSSSSGGFSGGGGSSGGGGASGSW